MALDISCAYYFTVTSATGSAGMAAQETGFALAFDLALLGSGHGFWSHVKSDGGDIRAANILGIAIGTGYQNSVDIAAQSGNVPATCAAVKCREYAGGGLTDWFLPSKDELMQLYTNRSYADFPSGISYWMSSEASATEARVLWDNGSDWIRSKGDSYKVRPIRTGTGTYSLGDTGPGGGKIFYISGTTYLEAAPKTWSGGSEDPGISWSTGANQSALVDGAGSPAQLALHVVEIDVTNKKGLIRFNDTSPTAATTWRIYYGNASAGQPSISSTYGANNAYGGSSCLLAMPLAGTPADYSASSVTIASDTTDAETSVVQIGKSCRRFNRNNSDKIDIGKPAKLDFVGNVDFTIITLSRPSSSCADGQFRTLFGKGDQVAHLAHRYISGNQSAEAMVYDSNWHSVFQAGYTVDNWHSHALTRNGSASTYNCHLDGVAGAGGAAGYMGSPRDDNNFIGENSQDTGRCFDGYMQMLEVYNSDKGANFVTSWHRMMMANSSFWPTISAERSSYPAPLCHYMADDGLTVDGSNRISQWDDQSGNGYHLTQATDNYKPTKVLAALNGLPVARFTNPSSTGNHQALENAVNWCAAAATAIAIVKVNNVRAWDQCVVGNGANLGLDCMAMNYTGATRYMGSASESGYTPDGTHTFPSSLAVDTSAYRIMTWKIVNGDAAHYGSYNSSTDIMCYLNRVAASAAVDNTQFNGSNSLVVGANEAGQRNAGLDGDIAEIMLFNSQLSDADRALVYDYLEAKYFPATTGVKIPWNRNLKNGAMQSLAGGFQ